MHKANKKNKITTTIKTNNNMAQKLHGMLNLSKIDKSLITTNQRGEKVLWVDILEKKNAPDQYGNTHTVTLYNKDTRTTIYLGDFKPQEFGNAASAPAHQDDSEKEGEDLPF